MQCVRQALLGSCRYAIICMVEKTAALAQGKGIFCKTITKSGLKLCQLLCYFNCALSVPVLCILLRKKAVVRSGEWSVVSGEL